jgi:hypothetical protein
MAVSPPLSDLDAAPRRKVPAGEIGERRSLALRAGRRSPRPRLDGPLEKIILVGNIAAFAE